MRQSQTIDKKQEPSDSNEFRSVLITTFTAVFLAELGDKTQVATLLLTAQSSEPVIVFIGSSLALICSSLVGVLLGRWIAQKVPSDQFNYLAGIFMIGIGLLLGFQSFSALFSAPS